MRDPSMGHGYRALYQGTTLVAPARPQACEKGKDGTHSRSVRCAFLSSPRAVTAVCSVESRRDGLIIAQHAVLGSEEGVDQSRKGRLNHGRNGDTPRNFLNAPSRPTPSGSL